MQTFLDRYEDAIQRLPVVATSPKGWVTVRRTESGDVTVALRRGVLGRVSEWGLASELQAGLAEAYRIYREECRRQRRKIFGDDYDLIHKQDRT